MELLTAGLLLLVSAILLWWLLSDADRGKKLPPGPRGLPIIGSMLEVDKRNPYLTFAAWRKKFGEIICFRQAQERLILLNSFRAIKEAYVTQGNVFSGRPNIRYVRENLWHDSGISFIDGQKWHDNRKFVIRVLREFGVGKSVAEDIVSGELEALKERLDAGLGEPINIRPEFCRAINNVVLELSFGQRCGSDDPELREILKSVDIMTSGTNMYMLLPSLFPCLLKLPPSLLAIIERLNPMKAVTDKAHQFIQRQVDEHRRDLGEDLDSLDISQARDVCDALIIQKAKCDRESPGQHSFNEWAIVQDLLELFVAGTETITSTLTYAMFFMARHQDIQRKVQAEIDANIGSDRGPTMKDRPELHLVNAVLDENARLASVLPLSLPHRSTENAEVMGFFIPKDITVIANFYAVHRDPELWEQPFDFHPEHFLTAEGRYKAFEHLIPFSIGRRSCLGETLAKMELFLFFVGILQTHSVRLGDPSIDVKAVELGNSAITRAPLSHTIVLSKRVS